MKSTDYKFWRDMLRGQRPGTVFVLASKPKKSKRRAKR